MKNIRTQVQLRISKPNLNILCRLPKYKYDANQGIYEFRAENFRIMDIEINA